MTGGEGWRTPTAQKLAHTILSTAIEGKPAIVRVRREGALGCLTEAAMNLACEIRPLAPDNAPMESVAAAAGFAERMSASGSLVALISGPALRYSILLVDLIGTDPAPWLAFAGLFATARRSFRETAAGLVLLTSESFGAPNGCVALDDDAIVDVIDAMAALHNWSGWPLTLTNEVAMAVAVEVSRGDLDLLRAFAEAGPDVAFDPATWLGTRSLEGKKNLIWRGREEPDPIWLLHHDQPRLDRRRWRGQLTSLFPWLENVRIDYLQRRGWSRDAGELEFTQLINRLQGLQQDRHVIPLKQLRWVRNELAHGRAVSQESVRHLVAARQSLGV